MLFLSTSSIRFFSWVSFPVRLVERQSQKDFSRYLEEFPALTGYSDLLSILFVVLVITYLTSIFGELVPKRLALNNAENIASAVAKPIRFLSVLTAPLVMILSYSTKAVFRVIRFRKITEPPVTEKGNGYCQRYPVRGICEGRTEHREGDVNGATAALNP